MFKPRVLFIREKLKTNNFQESDSVWITGRMTSDDFYIDYVELSEFLNLDELTALYNFENAELEDRSLAKRSHRSDENMTTLPLKHSSRIF